MYACMHACPLPTTSRRSIALVCASLGARYWRPLDPLGAIVIALFIVANWLRQVRCRS
jgi:hypothetical protein